MTTVIELVEEIESSFASIIGTRKFSALRVSLAHVANAVDPEGAFGKEDEDE